MRVDVDGLSVFANTGGEPHTRGAPAIVFIHGAAMTILHGLCWRVTGLNLATMWCQLICPATVYRRGSH